MSDKEEVDVLERALFRLACTEDPNFEEVIQTLLPKSIEMLARDSQLVRDKVLLILNHINKRLRVLTDTKLPVPALVELVSRESNPFLLNFAIVYIEKGFSRIKDKTPLIAKLLGGLAQKSPSQQKTLLHIFLQSLESLDYSGTNDEKLSRFVSFLGEPNRSIVLNFILDVLLYSPVYLLAKPAQPSPSAALATGNNASVPLTAVPPALSADAMSWLTKDNSLSFNSEQWTKVKMNCLLFLHHLSGGPHGRGLFSDNEVLPHAIAGATIGDHTVIGKGEDLLKRLRQIDLDDEEERRREAKDSDDKPAEAGPMITTPATSVGQTVAKHVPAGTGIKTGQRLLQLYLGTKEEKSVVRDADKREPASVPLKQRLLQYLCRSIAVTNQPALVVRVVFDSWFGTASTIRLKTAGMQFLTWVLTRATEPTLKNLGPVFLTGLLKFLAPLKAKRSESTVSGSSVAVPLAAETPVVDVNSNSSAIGGVGPPPPNPAASSNAVEYQNASLRGLVYNCIGQVATIPGCQPLFNKNLKMLTLFFQALEEESDATVLQNTTEGLSMVRHAFVTCAPELRDNLKSMLLDHVKSENRRVKLAALQFANRLFAFNDVHARYMNLMLANDASVEVRDEAKRGSSPASYQEALHEPKQSPTMTESKQPSSPSQAYPEFPAFISYVSQQFMLREVERNELGTTAMRATSKEVAEYQLTLDFAEQCLENNAKRLLLTKQQYAEQLSQSLEAGHKESLPMFQRLIEQAIDRGSADLQDLASKILTRVVRCRPASFAVDYANRVNWVRKYVMLGPTETRANMAKLLAAVSVEWSPTVVAKLIQELAQYLSAYLDGTPTSLAEQFPLTVESVHGVVLSLGVLLSNRKESHTDGVSQTVSQISNLLPPSVSSSGENKEAARATQSSVNANDPMLWSAACRSIGRIGRTGELPLPDSPLASSQVPDGSDAHPGAPKKAKVEGSRVISRREAVGRLLRVVRQTERKGRVLEEAAEALGRIALGDSSPALLTQMLDGIFPLSSLKMPEVHFAVGKALARIGSRGTSLAPSAPSSAVPSSEMSSPSAETPMELILFKIMNEFITKGSAVVRQSSSVWLLCIIRHAGNHPVVQRKLETIQVVLTQSLTDSDQFTQECASKAMALLYDKCSQKMKDELVNALVRTFSVGQRHVTQDTQVLVDQEKGEYATYKDLVSIADDMGQPDLVYRFMDLASNHSIWNSRVGAAYSLESIVLVNKHLGPRLATLIPKLYRYQFDPNPKIKASMMTMWRSLVSDGTKAVDTHFDAIMKDLLEAIVNKQWRARCSGCLAMIDLIAGRTYEQVGRHQDEMWFRCFRAVDDINDKVLEAALGLVQALMKLSERLCSPQYTPGKHVAASVSIVIPTLLTKGIASSAKEVRAVSITALLKITKVAGVHLRPHLPELTGALLEGISTMEPKMFSHLQFHTASYNITEEQLEALRVSVAKSSPLSEALDTCQQLVDGSCAKPVLDTVVGILREGVGMPTLNAAARFITSLISLGSPSLLEAIAPHAQPLIRSLTNGLTDASPSVRKSYAMALGHVAKLAKPASVFKILKDVLSMYTDAPVTNPDNKKERLSGGHTLLALTQRATEQVKMYLTDVLPVAYAASHDPDDEVQQVWSDAWEELSPGREAGAILFMAEITQTAMQLFQSQSWLLKTVALVSLKDLITTCKAAFSPHVATLLPVLLEALPVRVWAGKEHLLPLVVALSTECRLDVQPHSSKLFEALKAECARDNKLYKRNALKAYGDLAISFPSPLHVSQMKQVIDAIIPQKLPTFEKPEAKAPGVPIDVAEERKDNKEDSMLLSHAYECLGNLWALPPGVVDQAWKDSQKSQLSWFFSSLCIGMASGLLFNVRVSILQSLVRMCKHTCEGLLSLEQIETLFDVVCLALKDEKFSSVRCGALDVLAALLARGECTSLTVSSNLHFSFVVSQLEEMERSDKDGNVLRSVTALREIVNTRR